MPTPSIVAFDLGKVLVDFDYSIAARKVAARSAKSMPDLAFFLSHSPVLVRYETGQATRQQFFEEVRAATGFHGTLQEFGEFFADIFTPIQPMVEIHAALRHRKIPTYIFSNTNDLAAEHIRRSFPFYSNFDGYIYSYEIGAMKPDVRIYEALEQLAGRRGSDIIYLDDRAENVAAGAARGWRVILHEFPDKTRAAIRELGLLDNL
jgi:glucose-1-phosphatase